MAEGRAINSNLNEVAKNGMEEKVQIGSRPPKCEKRCRSCVQCEAVQVPILPSKVQIKRSHYSETKVTYSSRGDESEYKHLDKVHFSHYLSFYRLNFQR
ncbi:hypothetical protein P8452_29342 [Trifolium repens]|nr:hypothetical protein P8452_29342 [Trifolium repens]